MKWIRLTSEAQFNELLKRSAETPQLIFKYSSRCGLSDRIKERLENYPTTSAFVFYFLDILSFRGLSNKIAAAFAVHHESPQVLLIQNRECIYEESHNAIRMETILHEAGLEQNVPGVRGLL